MPEPSFTLDDIIRSIEKQSDPDQQASPVGLTHNPFPVTGIGGISPNATPPLDLDTQKKVRDFLHAALSSQQFTGMAILGDFGLGKTHLLRWLQHLINGTSMKVRGNSVQAYYVSNPGIRPMDVLMAVTKAIGEEDFRKMIWAVVVADLRSRFDKVGAVGLRQIFDSVGEASILGNLTDGNIEGLFHEDTLASFGKFRERYSNAFLPPSGLRAYVVRVLSSITQNRDVVQALASMLLDEEMKAFSSWVSLTSTEGRQQLRVPQQDYFEAIFQIIKANGFGPVFLLIDEFEDVVGMRLNTRQRAEYLATLRLLIDAHLDDFSLVVAMVPQAWESTKATHPAFADRIGTRQIDLLPLNVERAEALVKAYLAQARDGDTDSLEPFTSAAVKRLMAYSEGNVRAFVGACYRVLQEHWTAPKIDEQNVEVVVSA